MAIFVTGGCHGNHEHLAARGIKQFVDAQVAEHAYRSSSEYLRELIRKQRDVEKLRAMLLEGANSGPGKQVTADLQGDALRPSIHKGIRTLCLNLLTSPMEVNN